MDLCCDHGHLGLHAYLSQQFPEIHFVDQVPETMINLEKKFHQYFKDESNPTRVSFITSDAGKVQTPLTGNVIIAGVGGKNMMLMLENLYQKQNFRPQRLILSPHKRVEFFQKPELFGLTLSHTTSVLEKGINRPIFVFN